MIKNIQVVIIGGSAGSLEVLLQVVPQLPAGLGAAIVLVLHRKSGDDATLEHLFAVKGDIPVIEIEDKTQLRPGHLYIAPADYHLLFETDGRLSLDVSEKINYSRPSIDVAFESAADAYGASLMGVLLSGSNTDGTIGLAAIREAGGTIVVQDPDTADMPVMPQSAIDNQTPHYVVDPRELRDLLSEL